jgi:membrane associated rhomboid family serine protease
MGDDRYFARFTYFETAQVGDAAVSPSGQVLNAQALGRSQTLAILAAMGAALAWPGVRAWWLPWAADGILVWLTGGALEDRFGRGRFAAFTAACAAAAGGSLLVTGHWPQAAWIGAGVAAGAAAAYLLIFPRSRVQVLVPVMIGVAIAEVPAWVTVVVWAVIQAAAAWPTPPGFEGPDAAALAAAGGAAAGALGGLWLPRPERMRVDWWDPPRRRP